MAGSQHSACGGGECGGPPPPSPSLPPSRNKRVGTDAGTPRTAPPQRSACGVVAVWRSVCGGPHHAPRGTECVWCGCGAASPPPTTPPPPPAFGWPAACVAARDAPPALAHASGLRRRLFSCLRVGSPPRAAGLRSPGAAHPQNGAAVHSRSSPTPRPGRRLRAVRGGTANGNRQQETAADASKLRDGFGPVRAQHNASGIPDSRRPWKRSTAGRARVRGQAASDGDNGPAGTTALSLTGLPRRGQANGACPRRGAWR